MHPGVLAVAVVSVALLLAVAACSTPATTAAPPASTDVDRAWCQDQPTTLVPADDDVPPDAMRVIVSGRTTTVGEVQAAGVSETEIDKLLDERSMLADWLLSDPASFDAACRKAKAGR